MSKDWKSIKLALAVFGILFVFELPGSLAIAQDVGLPVGGLRTFIAKSPWGTFKHWENRQWEKLKQTESLIAADDTAPAPLADNTAPINAPTTSTTSAKPQSLPLVNTTNLVKPKLQAPYSILIIGDSIILEGFGPALEGQLLTLPNVDSVKRAGKYSTGLNRRDYFNWNDYALQLIATFHPQVLVVMFGANDGQGILDDSGKAVHLDNAGWDAVYQKRVDDFLKLVSPVVDTVYWVGQPIPGTTDFYNKFTRMDRIFQSEAQLFPNVEYVDTWSRFAVNDRYSAIVPDETGLKQKARQDDGVHFTVFGGKILSNVVVQFIEKDLPLSKARGTQP